MSRKLEAAGENAADADAEADERMFLFEVATRLRGAHPRSPVARTHYARAADELERLARAEHWR